MKQNRAWIKIAAIVGILCVVVFFEYQSRKSGLTIEYWYWAGAILAFGLILKFYVDKFIARQFPDSKFAKAITDILFISLIVLPQLILYAWMYRIPD